MVLKKLDIPVVGPDYQECDACVRRFEERVGRLAGVHTVSPAPDGRSLTLTFDSETLPLEILERKAEEIGLDIRRSFGHRTYMLDGLTCADCARMISKTVERQPGILAANVSFPASSLSLEYEPETANLDAVLGAVVRLGYKVVASGPASGAPPPLSAPAWRTTRVLLTLGSGALLALGAFVEFALQQSRLANGLFILSGALVAFYVYRGALSAIRARMLDTDFLMGVAAIGAGYLGDWREAAAVLFLYTLGETLEAYTVSRARGAIRRLVEAFPQHASVLTADGERQVPTSDVQPGDVVLVRPGGKVPVDGQILSGASELDESLVTGESLPRSKSMDDQVFAGSLNGSGALEVTCTRKTADNTVNRIIHLVEDAQSRKAPTQRISERFGRIYTPIVVALAVAVAVIGPLAFGQSAGESFRRALILLTVSCPCALILSAPVAVVSALAAAARNGLLIKGGSVLEDLGRVRSICFDKTGTLTQGKLSITDAFSLNGITPRNLLALAASIESHSEHIIGRAIVRHALDEGIPLQQVQDFQALPGRGASGVIEGREVAVGSEALFEELGWRTDGYADHAIRLAQEAKTTLLVGAGGEVVGIIALQDTMRPEAAAVIRELKTLNVDNLMLLTGDRSESGGSIAQALGLHGWRAELLPEEKLAFVEKMAGGRGRVAMVGDGINDAPALARADVGIAIGSATDVSAETADVLLMSNDLSRLAFGVAIGQKAVGIIRANIIFSVAVVITLVALTLAGRLTLTHGVLGHEGSSLLVVANGMRLLRTRSHTVGGSHGDGCDSAEDCCCG